MIKVTIPKFPVKLTLAALCTFFKCHGLLSFT